MDIETPPAIARVIETAAAPSLGGGRCTTCGFAFFPFQRFGCERCGAHGEALVPLPLSPAGRVLSWATVHIHQDARRPAPFTVVEIALDDGPVVRGLWSQDSVDALVPDLRTEGVIGVRADDDDAAFAFRFVPASAPEAVS